jgi:hypothetical protein
MPKPKRPRSKPDLADRLCDAIKHLTAERASQSYAARDGVKDAEHATGGPYKTLQ